MTHMAISLTMFAEASAAVSPSKSLQRVDVVDIHSDASQPISPTCGSGFRVQGSGFRVQGPGFASHPMSATCKEGRY